MLRLRRATFNPLVFAAMCTRQPILCVPLAPPAPSYSEAWPAVRNDIDPLRIPHPDFS
jgi:hypothetical protein